MAIYGPRGSERQVNAETPASVGTPDIVTLASGRFLVTWYDQSGQYPARPGILLRGRIVEPDGTPVGAEFTIIDAASTKGIYAHVSARPGGGFLLTYTDPADNQKLLARLYDEAGAPAGAAVTVATAAVPVQDNVIFFVSGRWLPSGEYLFTWAENGSYTQGGAQTNTMSFRAARFDAGLGRIGDPFVLVASNPDIAPYSTVASLGGDRFAFGWADDNEGQVRVFRTSAPGSYTQFQVSPANDGASSGAPILLTLSDGNIAAVYNSAGGDTATDGIWAQVFTPAGVAVGPRVSIDQKPWRAFAPSATALAEGGFVVTWVVRTDLQPGDGSGGAVRAQQFTNTGTAVAAAQTVNTITHGDQVSPTVEATRGGYAVAWADFGEVDPSYPTSHGEIALRAFVTATAGTAGDDLLIGTTGADSLVGLAGNDQLYGEAGDDTLDGGPGNDTLYGKDGDDTLIVTGGTTAADTGTDQVNGGAGVDRLVVDYSGLTEAVRSRQPSLLFDGGYSFDLFVGASGQAVQRLTAVQVEAVTVTTGSGDDLIYLIGNGDVVATGAGNDLIRNWAFNGAGQYAARVVGQTRIDGGAGIDAAEVDWSDLTTAVVLDTADPKGATIVTGGAERYLHGVEILSYFRSGSGDDRITLNGGQGFAYDPGGSATPYQQVWTGAGNDVVTVRGKANNAGIGFFQLYLEEGSDDVLSIDMSLATENLSYSGGQAHLNGQLFLAAQGHERVTILGGRGDDRIGGSSGNDVLRGGGGADVMIVTDGTDTIDGGAGSDTLRLDAQGIALPYGTGLTRTNFAFAAASGFTNSYDGDVRLGSIQTHFTGIERFDVTGTTSGDVIVTGAGDDVIDGSYGDDRIEAGAGNDLLDGGYGADTMIGGAGDDTYVVDDAGDVVMEDAGGGSDTVYTSLSGYILPENVERLVFTGTGAGTLVGRAGADDLTGGDGNDLFRLWQGGIDTASGGAGGDAFIFGKELTAADRVDGGSGADVVAIQGDYVLTLGAQNLVGVETLTPLSGSDARFGDSANARYSYVLASVDANVAAGQQLKVNGSQLLAGENLTFDGSAETDGSFFIYGGEGRDTLKGGAGADVFFLAEGRFNAGDTFAGGAGADIVVLRGSVTATFAANTFTGIETVTLMSFSDNRFFTGGTSNDYAITSHDGNVAAGATMTVNGAGLQANETMRFDGRAEIDGAFRLFGGAGVDTLYGGAGGDLIYGGLGADTLTGGGGNDVFRYQGAAESTASARDLIRDFATGDLIDLSRVDASTRADGDQAFAWLGGGAFTGVAGQLRATAAGAVWTVQGDVDGDGTADFELTVTVADGHQIGTGDFLF